MSDELAISPFFEENGPQSSSIPRPCICLVKTGVTGESMLVRFFKSQQVAQSSNRRWAGVYRGSSVRESWQCRKARQTGVDYYDGNDGKPRCFFVAICGLRSSPRTVTWALEAVLLRSVELPCNYDSLHATDVSYAIPCPTNAVTDVCRGASLSGFLSVRARQDGCTPPSPYTAAGTKSRLLQRGRTHLSMSMWRDRKRDRKVHGET